MQKLLVIDDEPSIGIAFQRAFSSDSITVITSKNATDGELTYTEDRPDVVVLDLNLPDDSGLALFKRLRDIDGKIPVIFITGHGTVESAIEATKQGAYDYLYKPLELAEVRSLLKKAFDLSRLLRVQPLIPDEADDDTPKQNTIVGRCNAMKEVYQSIGRVASKDLTVLLLGESGTGKELVAQAIYHHSNRAEAPFLAINCAAIPDTLLESEIFGHEKGAFTDAHTQRIGKIEQADGGTLFLDEVGDMSPLTQAKLLRVLQDQTFERVGSNKPVTVNVRIIAATNHNLKQLVSDGLFRADLFFRLSVYSIHLPPLRERGDDIELLSEYFLRCYSEQFQSQVKKLAPETLAKLTTYQWPGNVRELESVIKQSLLTARGNILLPDFLPALGGPSCESPPNEPMEYLTEAYINHRIATGADNLHAEAVSATERQLFQHVLKNTAGNQLRASEILGISRVTLRSRLKQLRIEATDFIKQD